MSGTLEKNSSEGAGATKPRIGVSSCLLGEKVRHDGEHKWHAGVVEGMGPLVEWVPVCPEVEAGMGVPREPVNLVENTGGLRLLGATSGKDWTNEMRASSRRRFLEMKGLDLDGFILKKNSPSCGIGGVPVFEDPDCQRSEHRGAGMFTNLLKREFPGLPIVDEEAVATEKGRAAFLEMAATYRRGRRGG